MVEYPTAVVPLGSVIDPVPGQPVVFKLDAEGAEPEILAGLQPFFDAHPTNWVIALEFAWHPKRFAALARQFQVNYITFSGGEAPATPEILQTSPDGWMLVLRPR